MSLYIISAGCGNLLMIAMVVSWRQMTQARSWPGWVACDEQPAFERGGMVCLLYAAHHLQQS